jgi:hypothetical protein
MLYSNRNLKFLFLFLVGTFFVLMGPEIAFASVESSLGAIQDKLINVLLPLVGIIGLCFAAFSFFVGNPNARNHLFLAMLGAAVGFGAPSIIAFIRGVVN